jgi:hypothetical protein
MKGKRSAAEEGRKLFNPLRQAHAKLEVIIHSDDATIPLRIPAWAKG